MVVAMFVATTILGGDTEDKSVVNNNDVVVVFTHLNPPWAYKYCRGAEIDIVKAAFAQVGKKVRCQYRSYARLMRDFSHKKQMFTTSIVKVNLPLDVSLSAPFVHFIDVVASFKTEGDITIESLAGQRVVAYQHAANYLEKELAPVTQQMRLFRELPGRAEQLRLLAMGRVDYIIGDVNILKTLAKELFPKRTLHINLVLTQWDVRSATHDPELMALFNQGLEKIRRNGQFDQIRDQYHLVSQ